MKFSLFGILFIICFNSCVEKQSVTPNGHPFTLVEAYKIKKPKDPYYIHYHVTSYVNDQIVKTSRTSPFPQVITSEDLNHPEMLSTPYLEVLQYMGEQDSAIVIQDLTNIRRIPPEYGDAKSILFGVKVVKVLDSIMHEREMDMQRAVVLKKKQDYRDQEKEAKAFIEDFFSQNPNDRWKGFITTPTGVRYKILNGISQGKVSINGEHKVDISYYGTLSNGDYLDSSFKYGVPYRFVKGSLNIMPGWNEIAGILPEGAKAIVYIPSKQAYDTRALEGNVQIPANEDLYFYFEVVNVLPVKKY
jgi:FKBP-type peptidyl-prolyl cis-trans isomerase